MNRKRNALILFSMLLLAGCTVPGRWESKSFKPEVARDDFNFLNGRVLGIQFTKASLILGSDHRYYGLIYYGENLIRRSGDWEIVGNMITFVDDKGFSSTYDFEMLGFGNALLLKERVGGTDVVLRFERMPLP